MILLFEHPTVEMLQTVRLFLREDGPSIPHFDGFRDTSVRARLLALSPQRPKGARGCVVVLCTRLPGKYMSQSSCLILNSLAGLLNATIYLTLILRLGEKIEEQCQTLSMRF
jgi:hypothetical protein